MKKLAIIGNMNNNGFALMRYLRDEGVDAHLLLYSNDGLGSLAHFRPEFDSWNIESYENYIHQTEIPNTSLAALKGFFGFVVSFVVYSIWRIKKLPQPLFPWVSKAQLLKDLEGYDVFIGSGIAPAVLLRVSKSLNIFFPYSTGVEFLGAPEFTSKLAKSSCVSRWLYRKVVSIQLQGLREASNILTGEISLGRAVLDKHALTYSPVTNPMVYLENPSQRSLEQNATLLAAMEQIGKRPYIFQCARQQWINKKGMSDEEWFTDSKNSDWVLRAFSSFVREHPGETVILVLMKYGPDYCESIQLCKELGIDGRVLWLRPMGRKEIIELARNSQLILGEFRSHRELIWGGSGWEALALGKPLVHSFQFKPGRFEELYGYPEPPLLKANSEIEIKDVMKALLLDEKMADAIGQASAEWFHKYNGASLAKSWAALIS